MSTIAQNLPTQVGAVEFHRPSALQTRIDSPVST